MVRLHLHLFDYLGSALASQNASLEDSAVVLAIFNMKNAIKVIVTPAY